MKLEHFGYNNKLETLRIENNLKNFEVGRIISEHKEKYIVITEKGEVDAKVKGSLRFAAKNREDYPAVGDWVALSTHDSSFAMIHQIFPRFSIISRQAVGKFGKKQIIATNIDSAFLVQSVDKNFNINRLERYMTICYSSKIPPIIILTKIDLIKKKQISEIIENIYIRIKNVPVIAISNETQNGYEELKNIIKKGETYCMLGSSGVGKSTLLNNLSGKTIMKTDTISQSTNKGRHITSHRKLIVLEKGGILIDNPGMREIGIPDTAIDLKAIFEKISLLSKNCKFKNCTHTSEVGCAILEAVKNGTIDNCSYENYLKMEKEKIHFKSTVFERRKKDKNFGKMIKNLKKRTEI